MLKEQGRSAAADITAGKNEFIWKGPLYTRTSPRAGYYVFLIVLGVALGGFFYWIHQPISMMVVAAALLFFLTHATEVPKALRHTVDATGIGIDDARYPYEQLKSFWIADHPAGLTLYVERVERLRFPLSIPLERGTALGVRALLRQHLPESKSRGELLVDVVNRIMGLS